MGPVVPARLFQSSRQTECSVKNTAPVPVAIFMLSLSNERALNEVLMIMI